MRSPAAYALLHGSSAGEGLSDTLQMAQLCCNVSNLVTPQFTNIFSSNSKKNALKSPQEM